MNHKKIVLIGLVAVVVVLIILGVIAILISNGMQIQKVFNLPSFGIGEAPLKDMPDVNPTSKTNPFNDIKTNPFD